MILLPYETYTLSTHLTHEKIILKMKENIVHIKNYKPLSNKKEVKPFVGTAQKNSFEINRILNYRNSFNPTIKGIIIEEENSVEIKIKSRLNTSALIFISLFIITLISSLIELLINKENDMEKVIIAMILFSYLLMILPYKFESLKSKKILIQIFEAEIK